MIAFPRSGSARLSQASDCAFQRARKASRFFWYALASLRVDVALGAAHLVGLLDQLDSLGQIDEAFGARNDLRIVGLSDERRHEPDLERAAIDDEKVCLAQLADERGARHHEMRILITLGQGGDIDLVFGNLGDDGPNVGIGDNQLGLGLGRDGECETDRDREQSACYHQLHWISPGSQNECAPWGPTAMFIWSNTSWIFFCTPSRKRDRSKAYCSRNLENSVGLNSSMAV